MEKILLYIFLGVALLTLIHSVQRYFSTQNVKFQNPAISDIASIIASGGNILLNVSYRIPLIFIVLLGVLLFFNGNFSSITNGYILIPFLVGAILSGIGVYVGMKWASKFNERTALAAQKNKEEGAKIAFAGSTAISFGMFAFGILGLTLLILFFNFAKTEWQSNDLINILLGYALGISAVSLFVKAGGSILHKGLGLGKNLAQKDEEILRHNPLNPSITANKTAEKLAGSGGKAMDGMENIGIILLTAMLLGTTFSSADAFKSNPLIPIMLPLTLAVSGLFIAMLVLYLIPKITKIQVVFYTSITRYIALILFALTSFVVVQLILPKDWEVFVGTLNSGVSYVYHSLGIFWCVLIGIVVSFLLPEYVNYINSEKQFYVKETVEESKKGAIFGFLQNLGMGMESVFLPVFTIIIALGLGFYFAGNYGIAMTGTGMLMATALQLSIDIFTPIVSNATTIVKTASASMDVQHNAEMLDDLANTNVTFGKAYSNLLSAAGLIALFTTFVEFSGLTESKFDWSEPAIWGSLIVGAMLPFLFTSYSISIMTKVARQIVAEVHRQFNSVPSLNEAFQILRIHHSNNKPYSVEEEAMLMNARFDVNYHEGMKVSARKTLYEILFPIGIALGVMLFFAFRGSIFTLASFLLGVVVSTLLLSFYFLQTSATWQTTKQLYDNDAVTFEEGSDEKISEIHRTVQTGEVVMNTFREATVTALSSFAKFIGIIALIILPRVVSHCCSAEKHDAIKSNCLKTENLK